MWGETGTRTRGLLRDSRSNQLNYAPALPLYLFPAVASHGLPSRSVPFGRAVTGQRSADNRKSDFLVNEPLKHGLLLLRSRRNTPASRQICPKDSRKPLALTFPDTSLFIKVVRSSERKNR